MLSSQTRRLIRQRAKFLCEYCHSPEYLTPDRFTVDHILPQSLGGLDRLENLALACRRCNERRSNRMVALDPEDQQTVSLFNPRQQKWEDHFVWTEDGTRIIGVTPVGRATCSRLDMNDDRYPDDDSIRSIRQLWVQSGWHPPLADPRRPLVGHE